MATITPRYDREDILIGWQAKIRKKGYPAQNQTFRTKAEALGWATVIEAEMVRGAWRDRAEAESTTLSDALSRYAGEIVPQKKGAAQEMGFLRQWQARPIGSMFLATIAGKHVAGVIRDMQAEGKSANTIRLASCPALALIQCGPHRMGHGIHQQPRRGRSQA